MEYFMTEKNSKTCTQCKEEKLLENFYPQQQRNPNNEEVIWYYYDSMCKPCRLSYSHDRTKQRKIDIVEYMGGKCVDCGLVDDPVVYDCHHLDPTQKDFSIAKNKKSLDKIKPELDKCILLCANCHRKRHQN